MPYNVHIERDDPITLGEWWAVVDADPTMERVERLEQTNPNSGEIISITASGMARYKPLGAIFRWSSSGRITSALRTDDHLSKLRALAAVLKGRVVGDEGENY